MNKKAPLRTNNFEDAHNIKLTDKDLNLIFKWYDKGFTNVEEDKPLLDRLKRIYQGI